MGIKITLLAVRSALHLVLRFKVKSGKGENVAEFVAGLRRLSEHCQFRTTLKDMLRDRLVCGISDDRIQRRMLAERELSFEKAMEIATATEMASKNLIHLGGKIHNLGGKIHNDDIKVNKVDEQAKSPNYCSQNGSAIVL